MTTIQLLKNDGDCLITFDGNEYKIVCRIDDLTNRTLFSQQIIEFTKQGKSIIPRDVLNKYYEENVKIVSYILNGIAGLVNETKIDITKENAGDIFYCFYNFLIFRDEMMGITCMPEILFALPPSKKDLEVFVSANQVVENSIKA